jgi:hypothetical protein
MNERHANSGAGLAGALLIAMPVLDLSWGSGSAGVVHAIVGFFGLAMVAVSAAGHAGNEQ